MCGTAVVCTVLPPKYVMSHAASCSNRRTADLPPSRERDADSAVEDRFTNRYSLVELNSF